MVLPYISAEFQMVTDAELKFLPSGTAAARLRLVTNKRAKDDAGNWYDKDSLFITADAYGDLAEHVAESLHKGDLVVASGELLTREWESGGQKKSMISMRLLAIGPSLRFRITPHGGKAALEAQNKQGRTDPQGAPAEPPSERTTPDPGTSDGVAPW